MNMTSTYFLFPPVRAARSTFVYQVFRCRFSSSASWLTRMAKHAPHTVAAAAAAAASNAPSLLAKKKEKKLTFSVVTDVSNICWAKSAICCWECRWVRAHLCNTSCKYSPQLVITLDIISFCQKNKSHQHKRNDRIIMLPKGFSKLLKCMKRNVREIEA